MTNRHPDPRTPDPKLRGHYLAALQLTAVELRSINAELAAIIQDFQRQFDESPLGQRQARALARQAATPPGPAPSLKLP